MSNRSYEPIPPSRVSFLGLGVMGGPMAGHLQRAGHAVTEDVYLFNPTGQNITVTVEFLFSNGQTVSVTTNAMCRIRSATAPRNSETPDLGGALDFSFLRGARVSAFLFPSPSMGEGSSAMSYGAR